MKVDYSRRMRVIRPSSSKEYIGITVITGLALVAVILGMISLIHSVKWINKPFPGFLLNTRLVVAGYGQYHWTGTMAGLRFPDRIIKADDQDILTKTDLEKIINAKDIGDYVKYSIERNGQIITVTIPTMRFTLTDFLGVFGIYFLCGFICLLLGFTTFIMKPNTLVSGVFLLECLLLGLSYILFAKIANSIVFLRLFLFSITFIPAAGLHLSFIFPEHKKIIQKYPYLHFFPYIVSTIIVIPLELFYPGFIYVSLYNGILLYIVISAFIFLVSVLYVFLRHSSVVARQRAKVILFGTALAFPLPTLIGFLASMGVTLHGLQIQTNFLIFPVLIFPASVAYAIARHNLFDVDVYIKRAVGYVIMTTIVGMIYFGLQTLVSTVILKPILGEKAESVYPLLFAILVVFFFNPLNHLVQRWVDRLFYRKKFDYKATVTAVSQALSSLLNLDEVIRQVIHTVRKEMFIDTTGIVLLEPKNRSCQTLFIGDSDNPLDKVKDQLKNVSINYDDPLLALLSREKKLITRYDIEEDPKYLDVRESCVQRFTEMGATLAIPMVHKDEMKGALVVGNKKSGHFYTREDIDLLTTLTSQGAVAIVNARLFEENLEKQRMEEELKIAHDIQVSMLPEKAPEIEGFEIAGMSIPAKEVGGDFYDYIEISSGEGGNRLAIVIGDVTGKGVSGALMMAASRSTYRVLAEQYSSVEELMGVGNRRLNKDIKKGMFVALLYAELNPQKKTLTLSNAGQTQPILCPADSSTRPHYIDTEGDKFPLGIIKDCTYQETEVRLKNGDVVVFYTDGVVEAMNDKGEMYGFERLMTSIEEGRGLGADAVMDKLVNDISSYVGGVEQHDDLTVVVVKME